MTTINSIKKNLLPFFIIISLPLSPFLQGCGSDVSKGLSSPAGFGVIESNAETDHPEIIEVYPGNNAAEIPLDVQIKVCFSKIIDEYSLNNDIFKLIDNGGHIRSGDYDFDGNVITFTPSRKLINNTSYLIIIKKDLNDLAGNNMESDYECSFSTESIDFTPPCVVNITPESNAVDVSAKISYIEAVFDDRMDESSINTNTFVVKYGIDSIQGTLTYDKDYKTVKFDPAENLNPFSEYSIIITSDVKNTYGLNLLSNYIWKFTTGDVDNVPPSIVSNVPLDETTDIPVSSSILAAFSEDMTGGSITNETFYVEDGAGTIVGSVVYDSGLKTATFTPVANLNSETTYTVTITTGVTDIAGNQLASDYVWTFSAEDITLPVVDSIYPVDGAADVPIDSFVSVTFNEDMNEDSITTSAFYVEDEVGLITGTIIYNSTSKTASFTPDNPLEYNTSYTVTIKGGLAGVQDLSANYLASDYIWTFTSELTPYKNMFVYAANFNDNNISVYSMNQTTGALIPVETESADNGPCSIAVNPAENFAYVANASGNSVSVYTINQSTGELTFVENETGGPVDNARYVAINPAGSFCYVANYEDDNVLVYSINQTTGALSLVETQNAGNGTKSVTVDSTGSFAFAANSRNNGGNSISVYSITQSTGELTSVENETNGPVDAPQSVALNPAGSFCYVANYNDDNVLVYSINQTTGQLSFVETEAAGDGPTFVKVDPAGSFVYAASEAQSGNGNKISVYSINQSTGELTFIEDKTDGPVDAPQSIAIDPSGQFLLVANSGGNNVLVYSINRTTGALTLIESANAGSGPQSVSVISIDWE